MRQIHKLDGYEDGYCRVGVKLEDGKLARAEIYIARSETTKENLKPTREYLNYLIEGAKEHNLSDEHIKLLKRQEVLKSNARRN